MKFKRLDASIELPEKESDGHYINVRSSVRVDVRPGETRLIPTGVNVVLSKDEKAKLVVTASTATYTYDLESGAMEVKVVNNGARNIPIYPGMVIAEIVSSATKKATIVSGARMVDPSTKISNAPGFHKKPCDGC